MAKLLQGKVVLVTGAGSPIGLGRAMTLALVNTGQGVFTGAATTAAAFFAMGITNFKGIQEMGIIAGGVMELFAIETMPFGASRYPEWGSAGVVAGASYVIGGATVSGALAIATLLGLATAWLGSVSMVWHRQAVARMAAMLRERIAAGSGLAVTRLHLMGISSDFWRGAFVSAVGLMVAFVATRRLVNAWFLPYGPSAAWPDLAQSRASASVFGLAFLLRLSSDVCSVSVRRTSPWTLPSILPSPRTIRRSAG